MKSPNKPSGAQGPQGLAGVDVPKQLKKNQDSPLNLTFINPKLSNPNKE